MKRIVGLFLALSVLTTSFAAGTSSVLPSSKKPAKIYAADVMVPMGKSGQQVSLLDLSHMKIKEVEAMTGKKMKLADKVGFKIAQKNLANSINDDGTINSKQLSKMAKKADGGGFHLGGFALGFFLGLIGVLLAYVVWDDENKHARTKWAWLGFVTFLVLYLVLIVAIIV